MPDYTLCINDNCPLKSDCQRYEGHWKHQDLPLIQSYSEFSPEEEDECKMRIPFDKIKKE